MWDDRQWVMERIADELIDNDDYFNMANPVPFLEWAADHIGEYNDIDGADYSTMLNDWHNNWLDAGLAGLTQV